MKPAGILASVFGLGAVAANFNPNHAANVATVMDPLPGKFNEAWAFFDKQTAEFRALKPAGQTALWSYPSGNSIVTIEQYVDEQSMLDWARNETHIQGTLPVLKLMNLLTVKMYTNVDLDLDDLLPGSGKS